MRTRVKICGITRDRDAEAAVLAGADALGFVFWSGSPRLISPERAAVIGRGLPPLITRVGVFVNSRPAEVSRVVRDARLDAIQLHGDEDVRRYASCGAAVIKAMPLTDAEALARARAVSPHVTLLIDAHDTVKRGGTGKRSNWRLARLLARERPILLAGGLTPATVVEAMREVRPWGIDVSSGVEIRPGIKSEQKLGALFSRVRRGDREAE